MIWKLFARDLLLLGITAFVWTWAGHWHADNSTWPAAVAAVFSASVFALLWGFIFHEWGHYLAALAARSRIHYPTSLTSAEIYSAYPSENSRGQFLAQSAGGALLMWPQTLLFCWLIPWHSLAGITAVVVALGWAVFTSAIEWPVIWRVARGQPIPSHVAGKALQPDVI